MLTKSKAIEEHASAGTRRSAVFNMCKIGNILVQAKSDLLKQRLHEHFADTENEQLSAMILEVVACMGVQELDGLVDQDARCQPVFLNQVRELAESSKGIKVLGNLEHIIELLTSMRDSSDEEDNDHDSEMREETPSTPVPGAAMSVLFMDE
jgi:hypothetical protein